MIPKGTKFTKEHKQKISEAHKGKSKPWMIGNANGFKKGQTPWNKDKKHSEETKRKIGVGNKGKIRTEETKQKIRINSKPWNKGKKMPKGLHRKSKGKPHLKARRKNHYRWKGGITPENHKIRNSLEMKLWREAVFKRDDWTCIWCGIKGGYLCADHIKPFALFPELRFAIDNGRTLCKLCHIKTDTYGNKKYCK